MRRDLRSPDKGVHLLYHPLKPMAVLGPSVFALLVALATPPTWAPGCQPQRRRVWRAAVIRRLAAWAVCTWTRFKTRFLDD